LHRSADAVQVSAEQKRKEQGDYKGYFMPRAKTTPKWMLASVALAAVYTDFILSRQAMNCTTATMEFYKHTAGMFLLG